MMGAIVTVGVLALLTSIAATLSNMVIKRTGGTNSLDIEVDTLPKQDAYRLAGFARAASLFHRQARLLWTALAVLLAARFAMDMDGLPF